MKILANHFYDHNYALTRGRTFSNNSFTGGEINDQFDYNGAEAEANHYYGKYLNGFFRSPFATMTFYTNTPKKLYFGFQNNTENPSTNGAIGSTAYPSLPFRPRPSGNPSYQRPPDCKMVEPGDLEQEGANTIEDQLYILSGTSNTDELMKWLQERKIYDQLKKSPSYLDSSLILQNYFDSTSYTALGKLEDLKYRFSAVFDSSGGAISAFIIQTKLDSLVSDNDAILAENIYEGYLKILNDITFKELLNETDTITEENEISLWSIANKCPFWSGPAVYEARALLNMKYDSLYFNDDSICITQSTLRRRNIDETFPGNNILVYPNPTTRNVHVYFNEIANFNLKIKVLDAYGKKVLEEDRNKIENGSISLDLNLNSGIYFIYFYSDDVLLKTEKIILLNEKN